MTDMDRFDPPEVYADKTAEPVALLRRIVESTERADEASFVEAMSDARNYLKPATWGQWLRSGAVQPEEPLPDEVEDIATRCEAASYDDRLADGMLYRHAAAMLRQLAAKSLPDVRAVGIVDRTMPSGFRWLHPKESLPEDGTKLYLLPPC